MLRIVTLPQIGQVPPHRSAVRDLTPRSSLDRCGEHRRIQREGDQRHTGTRNLWIKKQANLADRQQVRFDEDYNQQLETGKAWAYKEMLRDLWHHEDAMSTTDFFKDLYTCVIHTKLKPL